MRITKPKQEYHRPEWQVLQITRLNLLEDLSLTGELEDFEEGNGGWDNENQDW